MASSDLRSAVTSLRRAPAFTLAAVGVVALAIGANTAIFSVVHGVLLRPLPFPHAERIVRVWSSSEERDLPFFSVSLPDYADWRARAHGFEALAAYERQRSAILGGDVSEITVTRVTAELFPLLGVTPARGRSFRPEDAAPTAGAAALISDGLWQRRFGGRQDVLGRTLVIDGKPWTVVGVMPPRFEVPNAPSDVWLPLAPAADDGDRSKRFLRVLGRLREGTRLEGGRRELAQVANRLAAENPASNAGWTVALRPLVDTVVTPEFRRSTVLLAGAVAFVLLMACANLSGLLLSRATARRREMAVRAALGASRAALIRLSLVESLILALASGTAGVLLAVAGMEALRRFGAQSIPRLDEVALSTPVLAFAALITLLTVGLFGLIPALDASRGAADHLRARGASADARTSHSRNLLVVVEVALAVILLVGAGLTMRSFVRLQQRELGFDGRPVVIAQLTMPQSEADGARDLTALNDRVVDRLAALPGVVAATGASSLPFAGPNSGDVFEIEGRPTAEDQAPDTDYRVVTEGYFRTLGIPLLRGRGFASGQGAMEPAVILSAAAVRRYWRDRDPIGERIRLGGSEWMTIVGVAADARYRAIGEPGDELRPMMYVPQRLMPDVPLTFALRTTTPPAAMVESVRAALREVAPDLPVSAVTPMSELLAMARATQRFTTMLFVAFAWVAVILAAAGMYALIAYLVSRRTKEIGVRVALGASALAIARLTAGRGLLLATAGVVLGMLGSWGLARSLRSVLFDVSPTDPATYAVVAAGFLLVTAVASYLPARRALRIDPVEALRAAE